MPTDPGAPPAALPTDFVSLDPGARTLFQLQALWGLVVFWMPASFGLVALLTWLVDLPVGLALGGSLLALQVVRAVAWPVLAFRQWGYRLEADVLLVRRGVLYRTVTAIPRSRIQHVDVRQGPLEQLVGLARLQVHTASGLGADGAIPGLSPEDADLLRKALVDARGHDGV
jgi:membrane protein YdbS with pleckstrin-like domain